MSLSSETVDTLTEENNSAEDKGQDQGQKEEEGEEEVQRFSYEVDPDIGVIVWRWDRDWLKCSNRNQKGEKRMEEDEDQNNSP